MSQLAVIKDNFNPPSTLRVCTLSEKYVAYPLQSTQQSKLFANRLRGSRACTSLPAGARFTQPSRDKIVEQSKANSIRWKKIDSVVVVRILQIFTYV